MFNRWGSLISPEGSQVCTVALLASVSVVSVAFCMMSSPSESEQRREMGESFQCWIGWSLPPFLTPRQAPVFHLKCLWIYAANCSHLSSVNHLGAGDWSSPRPWADIRATGEIEWKPAKPDAPEVLCTREKGGRKPLYTNSTCLVVCSFISCSRYCFNPESFGQQFVNLAVEHSLVSPFCLSSSFAITLKNLVFILKSSPTIKYKNNVV